MADSIVEGRVGGVGGVVDSRGVALSVWVRFSVDDIVDARIVVLGAWCLVLGAWLGASVPVPFHCSCGTSGWDTMDARDWLCVTLLALPGVLLGDVKRFLAAVWLP
jgi:hypothetical protein